MEAITYPILNHHRIIALITGKLLCSNMFNFNTMANFSLYIKDKKVKEYIKNAEEIGYRNQSHLIEEAVKLLMLKNKGLEF